MRDVRVTLKLGYSSVAERPRKITFILYRSFDVTLDKTCATPCVLVCGRFRFTRYAETLTSMFRLFAIFPFLSSNTLYGAYNTGELLLTEEKKRKYLKSKG